MLSISKSRGSPSLVPSPSLPHLLSTTNSRTAHPTSQPPSRSSSHSGHSRNKSYKNIRRDVAKGRLTLSTPLIGSLEHKGFSTSNDWQPAAAEANEFSQRHLCDYCKNCEVHSINNRVPRSETTALLPFPPKVVQPRSRSRNPLKVISSNIMSFSQLFYKRHTDQPTSVLSMKDKVMNEHGAVVVAPSCTCCHDSILEAKVDNTYRPVCHNAQPPGLISESAVRSHLMPQNRIDQGQQPSRNLSKRACVQFEEGLSDSDQQSHPYQLEESELEEDEPFVLNPAEASEFVTAMHNTISKVRYIASQYNGQALLVEGEAQATEFMTRVTSPRFDIHKIKSLDIVVNQNDWSPVLEDALAVGISAFANGHSLHSLRIWIRGNTLFTRHNYILTATTMQFERLKFECAASAKFVYWERLYDGTATRETLADCPPKAIKSTKSIVKALLDLRNIPEVYVHGVMETDLKHEIIATCSGLTPRARSSMEDFTNNVQTVALELDQPRPYSTITEESFDWSCSCSVSPSLSSATLRDSVSPLKTTPSPIQCSTCRPQSPQRKSPRRKTKTKGKCGFRKSPIIKKRTRKSLLQSFKASPIEKTFLYGNSTTHLAPGSFDEVVRISSHKSAVDYETDLQIMEKHMSPTSTAVFEGQIGDCMLGWKVFVVPTGGLVVGREDELGRLC